MLVTVDSNFFSFFGFKLLQGNAQQCLGSPDRIVITENMAKKYFGNDNPIGKTLLLDDKNPITVSAVAQNAPVNSQIQFDFLVPASFKRKQFVEQLQF